MVFNQFCRVLEDDFNFNLCATFPCMRKFPQKWLYSISRDKLYSRKQAKYFTREDVRNHVRMLRAVKGSSSQLYYAKMADLILLISILFAGCRIGELLSIRLGQVAFVTVQGQASVAMSPGGSKTDPKNQRTSPIAFSQLADSEICPFTAFLKWLNFGTLKLQRGKFWDQ